jgi:phage-related protein
MSLKPIQFLGDSLDRLRDFPEGAKKETGVQLYRVQLGLNPLDWKPMSDVGSGVREIRIRDAAGAFRVIYVATMPEAVYILHCFQKKTQKTAQFDLDLALKRYNSILR